MSLTSDQAKEAEEARQEKKEKKKERKERDKEEDTGPYDVIITWAEECLELHDFFAGKMSGSLVNIVVLPLPSGLYHIRVYRKDAQACAAEIYFAELTNSIAASRVRSACGRCLGGFARDLAGARTPHRTQRCAGLQDAQRHTSSSVCLASR